MSKKPNILIIWGDDVGMWNLSCYHRGMMGGSTPNIDRIAKKGMIFMDHYAQASCTAGRAAFITGQYPIRVGLSTVGLAGAPQGMQKEDPMAMPPASSARTIWATGTSICRPRMASTNFSASSITSMPANIRKNMIIPRIPKWPRPSPGAA